MGLNVFRRSLYVDNCKVTTGVTTFDLHNEFLIYTTDSHTCRFIPLNSDPCGKHVNITFCSLKKFFMMSYCTYYSISALTVWNGDMPSPLDEGVRRVERGSRIVAVVPHDVKLILQV